ncbi:MAG: hypothetical protein IKC26_08710 [Clostridia bacterium]|nr:hypothetical protein [Clostridia bacterium]
MKKQAITKQDIQKELLTKLNKRKVISIFLTVIAIIGIILYPIHLINYLNGTPFDYTGGFRSPDLTPTAAMFVLPLYIIFFVIIVLYLYYIDLYKIKKGKFEVIEDTVFQKDKEWRNYYRNSRKESSLYFRCGRVAVEDKVYSYSNVGDKFYIVILKSKLKSKNNPRLAYHTNYYEIRNM